MVVGTGEHGGDLGRILDCACVYGRLHAEWIKLANEYH